MEKTPAKCQLRQSIIDEDQLARQVSRAQQMRRDAPAVWQHLEASRRARNEELALLNARLRALGLKPVASSPSLKAREQKLQRLRERNAAIAATLTKSPRKSGQKSRGTSLASQSGQRQR
jgi:hypothetical protein